MAEHAEDGDPTPEIDGAVPFRNVNSFQQVIFLHDLLLGRGVALIIVSPSSVITSVWMLMIALGPKT
ncbi:hypothetical protein D3C80_1959680 [compost metagenome]